MSTDDSPHPIGQAPSSVDELGARIVAMAGRLAAATCRWLLLVAEFDARDGSTTAGLATTAHWLGFACGVAPRTAIEHVRVARALATHPRLAEEMTAGRLSYSHVRAISRVALPSEAALVEELIQLAEHATVRQLEATVRGLRTVRDVETPTGPPSDYATHTWTSENQWRLTARLDPERGAVVASAIAAVVIHLDAARIRQPDPVDEDRRSAPCCTARIATGSRRYWTWAAHTDSSPTANTGRCYCATAAAASPAADRPTASRPTTSNIGSTEVGRPWRICWSCAGDTIMPTMTASSRSRRGVAAGCVSREPTDRSCHCVMTRRSR